MWRCRHSRSAVALLLALVVQGVSGLAGGLALVIDPTGGTLGLPLGWLAGSPFGDYLVPGLVLLATLGVAPLAVAWAFWRGRPWSVAAARGIGVLLLVWLVVEIAVIGYQPEPPLQAAYGLLAVVILGLTALPTVGAWIGRHV